MAGLLDELLERLQALPESDRLELAKNAGQATANMAWLPTPGPQTAAYFSQADELFYGGQAGGGKTALGIGLALTAHTDSLLLRRHNKEARKLVDAVEKVLGHIDGRSLNPVMQWKHNGHTLEMGGVQHEDDKQRYKGIAHDLKFFDEIGDFTYSQYMFLKTWNRSAVPGQRSRIVCAGNPPTTAEGLWVIEYWAPWLDRKHSNPAKDGELRWFISDQNDKSHEVPGKGRYAINHRTNEIIQIAADAPKSEDPEIEQVLSRSRTFIRARLDDNPYLSNTDYAANLDSLPAEIRAAYRDGRFDKSIKDNPWQVIPTAWVEAAQARWKPYPPEDIPMCSMGVDVAQGGEDNTVLQPRYDYWFDQPLVIPGKLTPLGSDVAAQVLAKRKDQATIVLDMGGGWGGGVYQALEGIRNQVVLYKGAEGTPKRTKDGKIGFKNVRTCAYWRMREALDPDQPGGSAIALPPSTRLLADLTAPKFQVRASGQGMIYEITSKEDVIAALGRSPDEGDAIIMAWWDGAKQVTHGTLKSKIRGGARNIQVNMGHPDQRRRRS